MNEQQHLGIYVRETKKHLPREVFAPVPGRLWWALPHLLLIALAAAAILGTAWPVAVKLLIGLVMGHSMGCLGFLAHEVLHGSVLKTPWLRDLVGGLLFSPFGLSPKLWRRWHNVEHHGHTQHPDLDPDAFDTFESYTNHRGVQFLSRLPAGVRSFLYFFSFTFWFSLHSLLIQKNLGPKLPVRERRAILAQTVAPYLVWTILAFALGLPQFLLVFVVPLLVANFLVIAYIATNHGLNPMTETNDPLLNSLSVTVPRWMDKLHFNFSHHVEHHVFPSVNPSHAPVIKATLKGLYPDRYREMPWGTALALLWRTPRFYAPDRVHFVDPQGRTYATLGHGLEVPAPVSLGTRLRRVFREPANALTHWLGVVLAVPFIASMVLWANAKGLSLWPFVVFGVSFALLYLASASYHSFRVSERALKWLRKLDHSAIFVLIAGSYTPIAFFGLQDPWRVVLLSVIWGIALAGVILKLVTMKLPRWVSTALYLGMGWIAMAFLPQLARSLPVGALVWLGVGGLLYTVGAIVYATKKLDFKPGVFGFHEVWHLFVLGGSTAHFAMMLNLR